MLGFLVDNKIWLIWWFEKLPEAPKAKGNSITKFQRHKDKINELEISWKLFSTQFERIVLLLTFRTFRQWNLGFFVVVVDVLGTHFALFCLSHSSRSHHHQISPPSLSLSSVAANTFVCLSPTKKVSTTTAHCQPTLRTRIERGRESPILYEWHLVLIFSFPLFCLISRFFVVPTSTSAPQCGYQTCQRWWTIKVTDLIN